MTHRELLRTQASALLLVPVFVSSTASAQNTEIEVTPKNGEEGFTINVKGGCATDCCVPQNLGKKIFLGAAPLGAFLLCFFLFKKLFVGRAIKNDQDPIKAGRFATSLSLLFAALTFAGAVFAVASCFPVQLIPLAVILFAIFGLYGLYSLFAS